MKSSENQSWKSLISDRQVFSWALYDWANSAFATTVMAGFFPLFFKLYWSHGTDVNLSTYQLGLANSLSAFSLALLSPILGAMADQWSGRKRFLAVFAALGVLTTVSFYFVDKGQWELAVLIYIIASIGFMGANTFYDALIISVARGPSLNVVSSFGFSLGYLGGGVLFALNVFMYLNPGFFGIATSEQAVKLSFVSVGVWWALFSLPLLFNVREEGASNQERRIGFFQLVRLGFTQVASTFREVKALKNLLLFLVAYFFYIDGVNAMMKMAVDLGLSLGFPAGSLITALLIVQFVGFPAALAYGFVAQRLGPKPGLFFAISVYAGVTGFSYFMTSTTHFYVLAIVIGLVQGGIQSLSRSIFAQMVPEGKSAEYFGFFNMLGKFSSIMGPLLVGAVSYYTQEARLSALGLLPLFAIGAMTLYFVKIEKVATQ